MFIPVWLTFLLTGIVMAVGVVVWAVRTRQFEESDRARYLPLGDLSAEELATQPPIRRGAGLYANLAVIVSGLIALAVTLALVIKYS
jgi:cbb3-type cytochrome oxidase subunit 3